MPPSKKDTMPPSKKDTLPPSKKDTLPPSKQVTKAPKNKGSLSPTVAPINNSTCDDIPPLVTQCLQRPNKMVFRYNGGDCSQSFNIQPITLFQCIDFNGGPPDTEGATSYIVITDTKGQNIIYYDGFASVGEELTLEDGGNRVEANMNITIFSSDVTTPENVVQSVIYHSSCSRNLFLKDRYGSLQLVVFVNELQGIVSCFFSVTFDFNIANTGSFDTSLVSLEAVSNIGVFNLTDEVLGTTIVPGETFVVTRDFFLDLTVRKTYTFESVIVGETLPAPGELCQDSDSLSFTAGNPLPPKIPTIAPIGAPLPTIPFIPF